MFLQDTPPERVFVLWFYYALIDNWWAFMPLHAVFSLLLLNGLWRIAYVILGDEGWAWIGLWLVLPILYHHHWGSNELYYPVLNPSSLAKAVGSWVWVGLLEKRIGLAIIANSVMTLLHIHSSPVLLYGSNL
ncbi:MAG: hypothetical protein RMJ66_04100 [Bacteroidia bacterium]|nr:hypothetical protein [Bacteroidia bacterium]